MFRRVCSSKPMRRLATCCAVLAAAGLYGNAPSAQAPDVIELVCTACHRDEFEASGTNPHVALQSEAWQARSGEEVACLACHGDVSEHVSAGGGRGNVFAFRDEPGPAQAERCLNCHGDTHPGFAASAHGMAGLTCTDCHSNHSAGAHASPLLKTPTSAVDLGAVTTNSASCVGCHGDVFSQFAFNERHRLREGILECTSCHDPHRPEQRRLLGGFKQEQCVSCHADKGGPFVFEHPAIRTEGCTACHSAHGSPNRHMLSHQRVGELCYSCHALVPQFHLRFDLDTQCANCHSTIHGSNFDPFFLK